MIYQTYTADTELASFVKCYWVLESPAEQIPVRQRIVPDGCMEMIFHYGDLYKQYLSADESIIQPRCFVFGQITDTLEIEPTGSSGIFSVRFYPDGFLPFASMPIRDMDNKAVSLQQLYGEQGLELENAVLAAPSAESRIVLVEAFLLRKLQEAETVNNIIRSTIDTILTANGQLSVNELSARLKVNRRQLERNFAEAVGLSPKQLSRIIRLQATLRLLLTNQFTSLTALAYEGNYYDQAHFIKDFREFTGHTPREFYGDHLKFSSLFIGTD
ncbi:MAG: AraC family transcriptional regulator [Sphingobacteriales bacterium]|nr:AraC family transcriptional regulator [Sphingobacteriales bacterium]OJW31848.1 MAG: AraC family transcriptional regulator [Sphingobacteriales bacterium 46-32]